ncbi:MAG: Mrp/NBP35 family ATP-binding protein [Chlamydiota bacterium]|nr:Mrp/NBP35 family ATP-binding protein [Chlamydiota bacterium]
MDSTEQIYELLKTIKYPGFSRDIVSFGLVKDVKHQDQTAEITLAFTTEDAQKKNRIKEDIKNRLKDIKVFFVETQAPQQSTNISPAKIPGISRIIAVASGKGGVGKSTLSVNLACALAGLGNKVAILDADISGPNIPMMCGADEHPDISNDKKIVPLKKHQLTLMSLGFFLEGNSPVIWRGPMIHGAIRQLINDTLWGEQDYLIVDLPPGTGDAQLTLSQLVPVDGAVIITTPQDVALLDASRGVVMFQKMNIPILGIIENMSYFICPHCSKETHIFKQGGGDRESKKLGVPFLGRIPLDGAICEAGDIGIPIVIAQPESNIAKAFFDCAQILHQNIAAALT